MRCETTCFTPGCIVCKECLQRVGKEVHALQVVVGVVDPNPKVGGSGIAHLQRHNIDVAVPCLEERCYSMNEDFMQRMSCNAGDA